MYQLFRKFSYLVVLLGLLFISQVHAIDGDYSNPYATDPSAEQPVWDGIPVYGGKNKELPIMTLIGVVFILLGISISGYCLTREKRQQSIN